MGKRVWESPPVPTVSGRSRRFNQEWITPSPGLRSDLPRAAQTSPRLAGMGGVYCEDCDIAEVSTPELDDVVRLEDRYGRAGT